MAYCANDDEQYGELQEMPAEHQMEERLVEALGHHVQDSVNWALIQALSNFAKREFLGESNDNLHKDNDDHLCTVKEGINDENGIINETVDGNKNDEHDAVNTVFLSPVNGTADGRVDARKEAIL
ncbi:hypothetical protein NDU88_003419 [Pleurodeles waltl]|uniref:Uncharacterized protein n=1 Tax=Pleurodeles waltl TaxID=8319 RepID=A0AAV7SFP0_PLEWA|nr:hypothetical protein NDU88_003419 [Pleurodeles waltl]